VRFVLPVVGLLGLVAVCSVLGRRPSALNFALAVTVALVVAAAAFAARRLGVQAWQTLNPFGSFGVIVILRDGAGGTNSGFGALLLLPVLWLALHRGGR
jgi:hypothetical protein